MCGWVAGDSGVQRRLFQAYWTTAPQLVGQQGAAGWRAALAQSLQRPASPAASGAPHGPSAARSRLGLCS